MSWRYKGGFIQAFFDPLQPGTLIPGLFSWGGNNLGQLGLNDLNPRSSPTQVGSLTTWSKVAGQKYSSAAIKSDGTLWMWGYGEQGQLGLGDRTDKSSPTQVGALTTWLTIAKSCGYATFAIKTDGTLWSWGDNTLGFLGQNNVVPGRSSPVQIGAQTDWSKAAAGLYHAMAVKTGGTLWGWGYNVYGQLGQNNLIYRSSPVQVGSLTTWNNIACGWFHSLATKTDGTLWAWGINNAGPLGLNIATTIRRSSPVQVGALTTWLTVDANRYFSCAIKTDGSLWTWGNGTDGQLGDNARVNRSSPVQVGTLTSWSSVSCGASWMVAIQTDGTAWNWGEGKALATNDVSPRSSPVQIGSLTSWSQVSCGSAGSQTLALLSA